MDEIILREIQPGDNAALAEIIRNALTEFKANKPGTVFYDETTDHLFELFQGTRGFYNVALVDGQVVGGGGIFPTNGLEADTCELVKMYLAPAARGKGIAKQLMHACLTAARSAGFKKIYIETMPELNIAIPMYEKFGFTYLNGPLGNSGHNGCDVWMMKVLD